jgi:hypothetical protein
MSQVVGLPNNSYKPITNTVWVRARLCKKPGYPERTTDHGEATGKLYQLRLRVECTLLGYCEQATIIKVLSLIYPFIVA